MIFRWLWSRDKARQLIEGDKLAYDEVWENIVSDVAENDAIRELDEKVKHLSTAKNFSEQIRQFSRKKNISPQLGAQLVFLNNGKANTNFEHDSDSNCREIPDRKPCPNRLPAVVNQMFDHGIANSVDEDSPITSLDQLLFQAAFIYHPFKEKVTILYELNMVFSCLLHQHLTIHDTFTRKCVSSEI